MADAQIAPELAEQLSPEEQAALTAEQQGQAAAPPPPAEPEKPAASPSAEPAKPPAQAEGPEQPVSYRRFKEVYDEAKDLRAKMHQANERWARLEERFNMAREADARIQAAAAQPQKPPRPDPVTDPVGAELWDRDRKIEQLETRQQQYEQQLGQTTQTVQQTREFTELSTWLGDDVRSYERANPDYSQAANHVFQRVMNFAKELGGSDQDAAQFLNALQTMAIQTARHYGKSPAAALHSLAKNMGYAVPANGNGQQVQQQAAPAPAAPPGQPTAAELAQLKLQQAQRGQAFQGLSRVPSENEDNINWSTMGAKELAEMDDDTFAAAFNDPKSRARLMQAFNRAEGLL